MRAAVITNGVVSNIIEVEALDVFPGLVEATGARIGDLYANGVFTQPAPDRVAAREDKWEQIKAERERRQKLGVKVGDHWFHSDADSRTQQLGLVILGANIPPNQQWKTLTHAGDVFVTLTQALAGGIFQATMLSDMAVFAAGKKHRMALEASEHPENYVFTTGWPVSFDDVA